MITTDIETFFAAITALAVAAFLAVEFLNQRRERRTLDRERVRSVFCCTRCGKIYLEPTPKPGEPEPADDAALSCPHCGRKNFRMRF
ncbi:MAG: hypothetical protein ACI4QA_03160 [Candidatus Spyradosoma sp.]